MEITSVLLTLSSGTEHKVIAFFLHEEITVQAAAHQRAKAAAALSPGGASIGVIGSPEWVVAGGMALGILGALSANSASRTAAEHFLEAARLDAAARSDGHFIPVGAIDGVEQPNPNLWRGTGPLSPKGNVRHYVHDGGPYLAVRTSQRHELWIAIDKIESYKTSLVTSAA